MNAETLKALKGSIKKWERIVRSTRSRDRGDENCPLCQEFDALCTGCPVATKTGYIGCHETPYQEWIGHHRGDHIEKSTFSRIPHCKECLRLAKAERDFLISLEPENQSSEG